MGPVDQLRSPDAPVPLLNGVWGGTLSPKNSCTPSLSGTQNPPRWVKMGLRPISLGLVISYDHQIPMPTSVILRLQLTSIQTGRPTAVKIYLTSSFDSEDGSSTPRMQVMNGSGRNADSITYPADTDVVTSTEVLTWNPTTKVMVVAIIIARNAVVIKVQEESSTHHAWDKTECSSGPMTNSPTRSTPLSVALLHLVGSNKTGEEGSLAGLESAKELKSEIPSEDMVEDEAPKTQKRMMEVVSSASELISPFIHISQFLTQKAQCDILITGPYSKTDRWHMLEMGCKHAPAVYACWEGVSGYWREIPMKELTLPSFPIHTSCSGLGVVVLFTYYVNQVNTKSENSNNPRSSESTYRKTQIC